MTRLPELPQEFLHSILIYDAKSGLLFWKERTPNMFTAKGGKTAEHLCAVWNANSSKPAGGVSNFGYLRVQIGKSLYLVHVIAWAMHYGIWPIHEIDHISGIRSENRIDNLRKATRSENAFNRRLASNNTSGCPGVVFHEPSGLWHARAQIGGKIISARYFRTREEAIEARAKLVAEHHGEFAVADLERQGYAPAH